MSIKRIKKRVGSSVNKGVKKLKTTVAKANLKKGIRKLKTATHKSSYKSLKSAVTKERKNKSWGIKKKQIKIKKAPKSPLFK